MSVEYLEIKDFPGEIDPLIKGARDIVKWAISGSLGTNKRDALLIGYNAVGYGISQGVDWFDKPLIGDDGDAIQSLNDALAEIDRTDAKSISPLLVLQIALAIWKLVQPFIKES